MKKTFLTKIAVGCSGLLVAGTALASHSWGTYHWGRTSNPLPLELGDNVDSRWNDSLLLARDDWNVSSVLDTSVVPGSTKPRNCRPKDGRAEICNDAYGNTGWLGIAQIWVSGDHIVKGAVKLNDSYFDYAPYNTPQWRNLVTCQEVGHIFGLGHQDENFDNANLGTCMDYTSDPSTNQHPNQHDYDMLEALYSHLDAENTYATGGGDDGSGGKGNNGNGGGGNGRGKPQDIDWNDPSEWGRQISDHAYERKLGNGLRVVTDVRWVEGRNPDRHSH